MDKSRLTAAVLSQINDSLAVTPYGHGHLVSVPLHYFDGDQVKLFVEPFQQGIRVTDRGATLMRLHMADLSLATPRVREAWQRSLVALDLYNPVSDDQIAAFGPEDEVGQLILKVAEATMRIDQLRWLATERRPVKFPDRVVTRLTETLGRPEEVMPQALLPQRSGRTRRVTAAVGLEPETTIYVQAVGGGGNRDAQEKSVEHCFYLFQLADQIPRQRRLAIAAGTYKDWDSYVIDELRTVSDVAFFDESHSVDNLLLARIHSPSNQWTDDPQT